MKKILFSIIFVSIFITLTLYLVGLITCKDVENRRYSPNQKIFPKYVIECFNSKFLTAGFFRVGDFLGFKASNEI
ncbi:hypothetical protein M1146_03100 [Patescibacteria group bacterium]|nr:hypothetical protein [Patescibacteria group bacterium]